MKSNEKCNLKLTIDKCQRSSSCHWITDGDVLVECVWDPTEPPEEPGCCYINPAQAYSNKYQETCISFSTERDCLKLTDSNGVPRCTFEPMNEYMDCSMVWPTTTTTTPAPGCCKGSSYKAQAKCFGLADQASCERKSCEWLFTDDEDDCVITTTETPTTTATPGCCKGTSRTSNDACNAIADADQCNRRSSCTFIAFGILDIDCVFPATEPPEEPGCCYGNPDIEHNTMYNKQFRTIGAEYACLMFGVKDDLPKCVF